MGKTVSFVVREELAEWLESQAEERMRTVSSLCQDLVAAEYRRQTRADTPEPGLDYDVSELHQPEESGVELAEKRIEELEEKLDEEKPPDELQEPPFSDHPRAWYEPDTQDPDEIVAVRIPDDVGGVEDRRYYKTYDGAAKAIRRWYE